MTEKEKTAPVTSVGADTEQSILKQTNNSITDFNENNKSLDDYLEEMQKEFLQQLDPSHLKTISMRELYIYSLHANSARNFITYPKLFFGVVK